ncbi:MAG: D-alanine--D-alanine ligase family protein [Anaerolineales bacterium]|nr:D-alanine--D-alanine ligase family protein [Anaerolineales bacterium]
MARKIRLGLIFGGRSAEHEVSLMSARSVLKAIDAEKYDVTLIGITKDGKWIAGADSLTALTSGETGTATEAALLGEPGKRELLALDANSGGRAVQLSSIAQLDVVFPLLHGPYGEDGTVQGLLELADLPYVGSGVLGSALAMDKAVCKQLLRAEGIPVVDWLLVTRAEIERDVEAVARRAEAEFAYPIFTKPANLGSSVGVVKAHDYAELLEALREAARYDRRVLIERGINAREIEVSVLGNTGGEADPIASVPGEIVPSREFYSYEAKYLDNASQLIIPAPLPPETAAAARDYAVRAFKAIDGAGLARVDFLLDRDSGELYLNEINTMPGFTQISMYPKLWEASGIGYTELIDRLIALALERQAEKDATKKTKD